MIKISTDFKIRNFQWDDMRAVVDLMNASFEADGVEGRAVYEIEEHEWRSPESNPEQECSVVFDADNRLVAFGLTEAPRQPNKAYGGLMVHPDVRHTAIGEYLIDLTETRYFNEVKDRVPQDEVISVQHWVGDVETYYREKLEAAGYAFVRRFYTMRIALDTPLEPAPMPEGFELRPFDPEQHAPQVHEAMVESFRDHWGHSPVSFDVWRRNRIEDPTFNANMWYIAWDIAQNRVAGGSLSNAWGEDIPELAWLATLGVRRDYRKRGLGEALLKHSFWHYQQLGYKLGGLGVDADNPTKALPLYQRVGMHVHRYGDILRKALRGRLEDVKDF